MEKTMYRKVEGKLYHYYRRVRQMERFEKSLVKAREQIITTEGDIANCNHRIENPLKSPSYDGMPKGPTTGSAIEQALIQSYECMERSLARLHSREGELIEIIGRIREEIEQTQLIIESLEEDDLILLELKYKTEKTHREIGDLIGMDNSGICRRKDRIICYIAEEMISIA